MLRRILLLALATVACVPAQARAIKDDQRPAYEDERLSLRLRPRTPEQVAAFYEARGFPQPMIDLIREQCFVTVGIHNKTGGILWHDLGRWRFIKPAGEIRRLDRNWWNRQWQAMEAPMPSRSTFRWTLLPEKLDFRPDEAEGGNITLPRSGDTFTLEAWFRVGTEGQGEDVLVRVENLRCADTP